MLATTVSYLNLLENKRHNLVTEKQQDRQLGINQEQLAVNQQAVNIQAGQLEETKRHNIVTENISFDNLAELKRHNTVTESINMFDAATRRSQLEVSKYDAETRRGQLGVSQFEAETHRYSALQSAGIGWANVAVAQGQLAVSQRQLDVSRTRAANDYDIGMRNANANIQQAEVAAQRQKEEVRWHDLTNDQNWAQIDIRQQQLEWDKQIEQQRYELDKADRIWRNTLSTVNTATNFFESVADANHSVSDSLVPGSKYIKKRKKGK